MHLATTAKQKSRADVRDSRSGSSGRWGKALGIAKKKLHSSEVGWTEVLRTRSRPTVNFTPEVTDFRALGPVE